ncbi:Uncharacterized protein TCM_038571 [Theobroma cacao]|uniref:Uncharacterized protein n=1 Tax=Theobroma cacao TaxID=3641 RepID=A0A061GWW8_THECC|nr:Uncharacterized protein TCM_038571 [Theobroma cacao]
MLTVLMLKHEMSKISSSFFLFSLISFLSSRPIAALTPIDHLAIESNHEMPNSTESPQRSGLGSTQLPKEHHRVLLWPKELSAPQAKGARSVLIQRSAAKDLTGSSHA